MGKVKDIIISLGHPRRMAEQIEYFLKDAGVLKEEEKKEIIIEKKIKTRDVSEVVSSKTSEDDKGGDS